MRVAGPRGRDTAWALAEQVASVAASILSFLLLGRSLGAAGYGAFVGLYALIGPILATTQTGVFLAALEHVAGRGERPLDVARSCLGAITINALLWVPLLSLGASRWMQGLSAGTTAVLVGTEFALNGTLGTCMSMVQALSGYAATARFRIAVAILRVSFLAALASAGALTLMTFALGQMITLAGVSAVALWRVRRLVGGSVLPGRVHASHVRSALLYGLGIGASSAQADGDKFVLNAANHQADAGRYGAAYRLIGMALLPVNALAGATHMSFLQAESSPRAKTRRAWRLSLVAVAYSVPAALATFLLAPLVPRVLTSNFEEASLMLRLLAPIIVLRAVGVFPMNALMGLGRNALRTNLLVTNAALSLALYAALIPKHSWRGALGATLLSEVTLCASGWVALLLCDGRPRAGEPTGDTVATKQA